MPPSPKALFVYGTLRSGEPEHARVAQYVRDIRPARVRGQLYALAAGYPALVVGGAGADWVYGEWLALSLSVPWAELDAYEDCDPSWPEQSLYSRVVRPVEVEGVWRSAWCYVMSPCRPPLQPGAGARRCPGGRWTRA